MHLPRYPTDDTDDGLCIHASYLLATINQQKQQHALRRPFYWVGLTINKMAKSSDIPHQIITVVVVVFARELSLAVV